MFVGFTLPFVDQPQPLVSWLLASVAVVIVGIAKSGFGGGVGIVAVPLFAMAAGTREGLGLLLPLLIAADVFSLKHHWGNWDKPNLRHLLPGSLLGIVLGSVLLWWLLGMPVIDFRGKLPEGATQDGDTKAQTEGMLKLAVGIICVLYVTGETIRRTLKINRPYESGPVRGGLTGIAAGIVSTVGHAAGPVTAIYLLGQKLDRSRFIGTTVAYYFIVNTIKLLPYAALGLVDGQSLMQGAVLVPLVPLGTWLGAWLNRKLSDNLFRLIILVIVFITGLQFIYGG